MKKLLVILAIGAFAACNDSADKAIEESKDSTIDAVETSVDSAKTSLDSAANQTIDSTKAAADSLKK